MITYIVQINKNNVWEDIRNATNEGEALDKKIKLEKEFKDQNIKFRVITTENKNGKNKKKKTTL